MEYTFENRQCLPPITQAPWLVYTHGTEKIQTFCTISSSSLHNKSYVKSIPELRGKSILASCHGWLLLRDLHCKEIFTLWNPLTLKTLNLPPLHATEEISSCTLMSPPNDHDDCVVCLFCEGLVFSCFNSSWVTRRVELEGERVYVERVVTLNGIIYGYGWAAKKCYFIKMEMVNHDSNSFTLTHLRLSCLHWDLGTRCSQYHNYLVESCGHIYSVNVHHEDYRVHAVGVWELDLEGMSWVMVERLDGRTFFLESNGCCTWCWGNSNPQFGGVVEENCVYFLMPDMDVKSLYLYKLKDRSLTVLLPCPNLISPFDRPTWVMPQQQSLSALRKRKQRMDNVDVVNQGCSSIESKELSRQNNTQEENLFSGLPLHIIELLPKYLHLFDYWSFRESWKIFKSVAPAIAQWRTHNLLPLFVFFKNNKEVCQVMDPCRDDSCSINLQVSRDFFTIDFSKDGWLLVCIGRKSLQYCNPFMRVRGEFPPCEAISYFTSVGFSTYPTSPDCLTIALIARFSDVIIYYLQSGDHIWNRCDFPEGDFEFSEGATSPIYHAGAFYFLFKFGYLGVFELIGGVASWSVYDKPQELDGSFHSYHLVECDRELLAVFTGDMGKWVKVFRFNHPSQNWIQVKNLGNHSLFIGTSSSFSVMTEDSNMGNRIYLARLRKNVIIFYSLESGKYNVFGGEDSMEDLYGTTEQLLCCWI